MLYLEYWLLSSTICYLSLPVIAGKNEHHLVLFTGKSKHHLDLVDTFFTTANFYIHGSRFNSEYCIITACILTDAITSQAIAIQPQIIYYVHVCYCRLQAAFQKANHACSVVSRACEGLATCSAVFSTCSGSRVLLGSVSQLSLPLLLFPSSVSGTDRLTSRRLGTEAEKNSKIGFD